MAQASELEAPRETPDVPEDAPETPVVAEDPEGNVTVSLPEKPQRKERRAAAYSEAKAAAAAAEERAARSGAGDRRAARARHGPPIDAAVPAAAGRGSARPGDRADSQRAGDHPGGYSLGVHPGRPAARTDAKALLRARPAQGRGHREPRHAVGPCISSASSSPIRAATTKRPSCAANFPTS
jgi:hypothetical protein